MKKERVVLAFIGILIGLICAGLAFYLYQTTKAINVDQKTKAITPTPIPKSAFFLVIPQPSDEQVVENKVLTISGNTTPDATIVIITKSGQEVIKPTSMGAFTTTVTLDNGENLIRVIAFATSGETVMVNKTITFSTEEF